MAREWVKKGHKVYIFSASHSHQFSQFPEVNAPFTHKEIDGIHYIWVKTELYPESKSIKRALSMLGFVRKLKGFKIKSIQRPDAIIVSSPSPVPVLLARRWARKLQAKLIFEIRDIWPLSALELGNMSELNPFIVFLSWIERLAYRSSDAVVSLLPFAKEHCIAKGMSPDKFVYIPNGYDLSTDYSPDAGRFAELFAAFKDKFIVGYVGAFGISNALESLIEAARELQVRSDILFVLVGDGPEKKRLIQLAEGLQNIRIMEPVKKSDVPSVLARFDCCYIGLKRTSLFRFGVSPNKVFDYMAAARPVLWAVEAGNNIAEEAGCGISAMAENVKDIANAITKFAELTESELNIMGDRGLQYLKKNHSNADLADTYLSIM